MTHQGYVRVPAGMIAEETTRIIERTWHSSRPSPRASAMGLARDETLKERRRRELREMLSSDEDLRRQLYSLS